MLRRAALIAFVVVSPLSAQEQSSDTAHVIPVIVTATRTPLSRGALPVAVTVITGDELRARGVVRVSDAIQSATSAYVAQAGSAGASTSLFLRGGESKYVKVLVDGVPANDPGGAYDFASLTTDNVERIEIVRGPASVLYGADAVTGVVHVITRRGAGATEGEVDVSSGMATRDTAGTAATTRHAVRLLDLSARTGGSLGAGIAGSYSVALAHHASTGLYELNNDARDNVVSTRADLRPFQGTTARLSVRYTDHRYAYPTTGGGVPVDSNAFFADSRTLLGVDVEQELPAAARATLSLTSAVNDGGTNDALDEPAGSSYVSHDLVRRRAAELRVQMLPLSRATLTLGGQIEHQDQRSNATFQCCGFPASASAFTADRHNVGVYGEAVATPASNLTVTLGSRVDDNEQFGTFTTGRAGVSWRLRASTRLRATAGTAFREPTFLENYATGYVAGNPQLQPERARVADAGVDQELAGGRANVSITAFAQRFENMIDYTDDTQACGYNYCNVAAASSNGVEVEAESRLTGALWGAAGATFLRTRVLDSGFDTSSAGLYRAGESLIRRPRSKWDAELSYRGTSVTGSARLIRVGERTDRDFRAYPATPTVLKPYTRIDVGGEWRLVGAGRSRTSLTFRVENLQNTGYQSVFNFLAPRRTLSVGVRAKV